MSDDEDYNSEEDVDYVPSDGELGSEEEHSGDEEDLSVLADDAGTATDAKKSGKRKQKKNDLAPRKRKGGIKLEDDQETTEEPDKDPENVELAQKIKEEETQKKEVKEKKKADDLWSSFLSDVKPQARPVARIPLSSPAAKPPVNGTSSSNGTERPPSTSATAAGSQSGSQAGKVTITKVFDFAGEEVKVTKQVDADSKEARQELKKQEQMAPPPTTTASTPSASPSGTSTTPSLLSAASSLLGSKRPAPSGGLSSVLGKLGKKHKMGTLDKSKMDWENFKKKEGIEDELKIHNKGKDGYIERMSFLNRTDLRQFEIERDLRLSKSGKR